MTKQNKVFYDKKTLLDSALMPGRTHWAVSKKKIENCIHNPLISCGQRKQKVW